MSLFALGRTGYQYIQGFTSQLSGHPIAVKAQRIWSFARECIFKEFASCLRHVWYRAAYVVADHPLNKPVRTLQAAGTASDTAKVILLVHADMAHPSSFISLGKYLSKGGISNIFTVKLKQSKLDPVPIDQIHDKIVSLTNEQLSLGFKKVDVVIVGHSLGGVAGLKYIYSGLNNSADARVAGMISIAGRLKYMENDFSWFCADVRDEIEATYRKFEQDPEKVELFTIRGDRDKVVPAESVHMQKNASNRLTVAGWGHNGIIFSPDSHRQILEWVGKV